MKITKLLTLPFLLPAALASTITANVTTTNGPVFGTSRDGNGILSFKGIPFAAPPINGSRWKPPTAPAAWSTLVNATAFGPTCYQFLAGGPPVGSQSEDCLTANVWTGAQQTTEKRPVMVFIYGGGFQFGSSNTPTYNGELFAEQGVVLVTFNYRLGNFGFLALPQLDSEGSNSGDFGLQDQVFALNWVQQNIAAFGGDPSNVLIFGESAGAHSVGMLMTSSLAKGKYNKAILESGAWWDSEHGSITNFTQARAIGTAWTQRIGVTDLPSLRALPAQTIVSDSLYNIATDPALTAFSPSIDNYVLSQAPGAVFRAGQQAKVPLLAGWNAVEEYLFLPRALPHNTAAEFASDLPLLFGSQAQQALSTPDLYPANSDAQANASATALIGDLIIREQTWEAADTQRQDGNSVYVYFYNYTSAYTPVAAHTAELPFVFGTLTNNPTIGSVQPAGPADQAFAKQVQAYWVNFAKSANPNGAGLPTWPAYSAGSGAYDILGLANPIAPVNYDLARFKFTQKFRTGGILPTSWRSITVSEANP